MPALEPFAETMTNVTVGSDLINSLRVLVSMLQNETGLVEYKLEARVVVDLPTRRRLILKQSGQLPPKVVVERQKGPKS